MSKVTTAFIAVLAFAAFAGAQETVTQLPAASLAGVRFLVPNDFPEGPTALIIGFTRASRTDTSAWSRQIAQDATLQKSLTLYQVAVLEDIPPLLRHLLIRSIRSDVPEAQHGRFLLVTEQAAAWKALVTYTSADSAYLLLLDATHRIRWRTSGPRTELSYRALTAAVAALGEQK